MNNKNNNEELSKNNKNENNIKIIGGSNISKSIEEHMEINKSEAYKRIKKNNFMFGIIIVLLLAIGVLIVSRLIATNNHLFAKATTTTTNDITISTSSLKTKDVVTIKPNDKEPVSIQTVFDDGKANKNNKAPTLKSLSISGYSLEPSFSPNNTTYKVVVTGNISDLDIIAVPSDSKSNIEINNGTSFENYSEVNVKITNNYGNSTVYKLKIYRK